MMEEMQAKGKWIFVIGGIMMVFLLFFCFGKVSNRITYIEKTEINIQAEQAIGIADSQTLLEQEFVMPFELFQGIDVKIGTFGRNNNSFWNVVIREKESGKKIYDWNYNSSQVSDGENYYLYVKSPVRVKAGAEYTVSIFSKECTGDSALALYTSATDVYKDGELTINGEEQDGDLCLRIYGGEKDIFWSILYIGILTGLGCFMFVAYKKRKEVPLDKMIGTLGTVLVFMVLMYVFSRGNMGTFTDECDNIQGGMLIAKGKVLYRDYYTQHTPFAYYLCGLFALMGAHSIQQYRLLYYLLLGIIWAGLYYRHSEHYGKIRMFCLPVLQVIITAPMFFQSSKIMGDNIQGICMVALVMEYLRYWEDKKLEKSRSLIVAACIYISIASAFISVFALAPIIVSVLIKEVYIWREKIAMQERCKMRDIAGRYGFLVGGTAVLFIITLLYFCFLHAIRQLYQMAYQFNTMVYNQYQNQYGRVKWKPFFLGVKNYMESIRNNLYTVLAGTENDTAMVQLILAVAAIMVLVLWMLRVNKEGRWIAATAIFLCMSGSATRAMDFHSIAMWNIAVAVIVLIGIEDKDGESLKEKKSMLLLGTAALCYCVQPYVTMVADHIVYRQETVDSVDEQIIAMTEPGEEIFIDTFIHDAIYLISKDRYPANRNCYFLPWYMDWFEYDTIKDLQESEPAVLVYRPETDVYGQTDFFPMLNQEIQSRYERLAEDSIIWKLK